MPIPSNYLQNSLPHYCLITLVISALLIAQFSSRLACEETVSPDELLAYIQNIELSAGKDVSFSKKSTDWSIYREAGQAAKSYLLKMEKPIHTTDFNRLIYIINATGLLDRNCAASLSRIYQWENSTEGMRVAIINYFFIHVDLFLEFGNDIYAFHKKRNFKWGFGRENSGHYDGLLRKTEVYLCQNVPEAQERILEGFCSEGVPILTAQQNFTFVIRSQINKDLATTLLMNACNGKLPILKISKPSDLADQAKPYVLDTCYTSIHNFFKKNPVDVELKNSFTKYVADFHDTYSKLDLETQSKMKRPLSSLLDAVNELKKQDYK